MSGISDRVASPRVEMIPVGPFQGNCLLVSDGATGHVLIVDPGADGDRIIRAVDAGIKAPQPVAFQGNVLVMEFIGKDCVPAPRLKDVKCDSPDGLFDVLVDFMNLLYQKAGLIHADFSEYNVLMDDGEPVLIDMGQSVLLDHPRAQDFLVRDIENVIRFFSKLGVEAETRGLIQRISGQ